MNTQKETGNPKSGNRWDSDENGVIVAGPEAHARERAGSDPKASDPRARDCKTGENSGETPPERH